MSSYTQAGGWLPQHSTRRIAVVHHSELKMPNCWLQEDPHRFLEIWSLVMGPRGKWLKCQRLRLQLHISLHLAHPCSGSGALRDGHHAWPVCLESWSLEGVKKEPGEHRAAKCKLTAFAEENLYITTNMQEEPASPERGGWSLIASRSIKLSAGGHTVTEPACDRWTCQLVFEVKHAPVRSVFQNCWLW